MSREPKLDAMSYCSEGSIDLRKKKMASLVLADMDADHVKRLITAQTTSGGPHVKPTLVLANISTTS
jgi:hypothetical protein